MSNDRPLHISRRKWAMLGLGVFLIILVLYAVCLIFLTASLGSISLASYNLATYALLTGVLLLGVFISRSFFASKKIEFFEDHILVHMGGNRGNIEFPYSKVKLSFPRMRMIGASMSPYFKLILIDDKRSFDIADAPLKRMNTNLYSWLREKIS